MTAININKTQETILIVDDNPDNLRVLSQLLTNSDWDVLIATDGEMAIEQAEYAQPDLILLDVLMPGIDGFETCRRLKVSPQASEIPLIFMTALDDVVDKVRGFSLGAVDYITKPVQAEEVLARIKVHLELRRLTKVLEDRNTLLKQTNDDLVREIVERQQIEDALRVSEAKVRSLVENAPSYIALIDQAQTIQFLNRALPHASIEQLIGTPLKDFVLIEDQIILRNALIEVFQAGESTTFEVKGIGRNQTNAYYEVRIAPIQNDQKIEAAIAILTDTTVRKQAELSLQESQQFIQSIADSNPSILYIYDLIEQCCIYVNREVYRFLGYGAEEVLSMKRNLLCTLMHPDDLELMHQKEQAMANAADGETFDLEYRIQHANGEWRWFQSRDTVFRRTAEGQVQQVIGTAQDITDRKQAEQALRENEQKYRQILDSIGDMVIVKGTDSRLVMGNKAFRNYYGMTSEELQGIIDAPFNQSDYTLQYLKDDAYVFETGQTLEILEEPITRYDGEVRLFSTIKSPIRNQDAEIGMIVAVCRDITDRKQTEAELRASEIRFRSVFEQAAVGIVQASLSGQFLQVNQRFCEIVGYSESEILQRDFQSITYPEDLQDDLEGLQLLLADKTSTFAVEKRYICKNGRLQWVNLTGSLVRDVAGTPQYFVAIVEDIQARKQAEIELQQAKEAAEAANRAKGTFLANMSHELRTPLNAILGFTQLMVRNPSLEPKHREQLSIINRSGEHLLNLINDILEMSKIEAGRVSLKITGFDLYHLLRTLEDMFKLRAMEKGLTLMFDCAADVPQYIQTDEGKLRQVLLNLLSNAIKFTHTGSVILKVKKGNRQLAIPHERLDPEAQETMAFSLEHAPLSILFEVGDTGPGIAPNDIETLFEPFVQAKTGQSFQEGTGLGLPISRQFVLLMGGEIEVESLLETGTSFRFEIPVELAEATAVPDQKPKRQVIGLAPNQPTYRILIVEDNWTNRQFLVELIEPLGFQVQEASNGREAIKLWEIWQPHLIWMDMRMPIMDGYTATQKIKSSPAGQSTVIIALTASAFEEQRSLILEAGCNDFVRKPARSEVLFEKMAEYLGVRYIYEEPSPQSTSVPSSLALTVDCLSVMPPPWINQLYQATTRIDDEQMIELIEQIPSEHAELAEALLAKVNNFDFEDIIELTQAAIEIDQPGQL